MTRPAGMEIVLDSVSKVYRSGERSSLLAVDDLSLRVDAGTAVALTGASGSGKSTLLHLVGAMDACTTGRVRVDGVELGTLRRREQAAYRRSVGFVFQRFHLLPVLSLVDNVLAPLLPHRIGAAQRDRAEELINAVGLAGRERALPSQLSGGQQQRVAIARALINSPRLLLADEPTGNLDSTTGQDVLALLFSLQEEHRMTMVLATHDPEVAARCERLLRMRDGRVIEDVRLEPVPTDLLRDVGRLSP